MRDRKQLTVTEHGDNTAEWRLAGPKTRAAARAIDAVITVALALAAVMVAGFTAAVVTLLVHGFSGSDNATLYVWLILFSLLALIPMARYEVTATARRGQTLGKKTMGLRGRGMGRAHCCARRRRGGSRR